MIGIHLVLDDQNGNSVSAADVARVTTALAAQNYDGTTCMIIGQISVWQQPAGVAYARS